MDYYAVFRPVLILLRIEVPCQVEPWQAGGGDFIARTEEDCPEKDQDMKKERYVSAPPVIRSSWDDLLEGISSREEWLKKKTSLKKSYLELLRDEYKPDTRPKPDLQVHEETVVDDSYIRKLISYRVESDERAHAYLALPLFPERRMPGIVALHGTYPNGKDRAAGLEDNYQKAYLDHLARRNYVVIAPDHFVAGHRIPPEGPYETGRFYRKHPEWTAVGKFTWEHSIAVDILQAQPEVLPEKIGVLGHSLGGQGSLFLAAYDERIKAAACNCSAPFFRHNREVLQWSRDRWYIYFKPIRQGLLDGKLPPIDFHEIMALIAPRPLLDLFAVNDGDPLTQKQRALMGLKVLDAYAMEGASDNFSFYVHGQGHSVPMDSRALMYAWMDKHLCPHLRISYNKAEKEFYDRAEN